MDKRVNRGAHLYWIDVAKTVGIILVVLAHALPKECYPWGFIQQFHMPLFYFISGYLFTLKDDWVKFILSKVKSIWLPFVSSAFISILICKVVDFTCATDFLNVTLSLKYFVKLLFMIDLGPLQGATWFLSVLFYSMILFDLIHRITRRMIKNNRKEIVVIVIALLSAVAGLNLNLLYYGSHILVAIAFLECGYFIKIYNNSIDKIPDLLCLMFIIAVAVISTFNQVSVANNQYTYKSFFVFSSLLGTISIVTLCKRHAGKNTKGKLFKCVQFIGKNTIGVVIWQFVAFKVVMLLQVFIFNLPWSRMMEFPVLYDYANIVWVILNMFSGIYLSISIYKVIGQLGKLICSKKENRLVLHIESKN